MPTADDFLQTTMLSILRLYVEVQAGLTATQLALEEAGVLSPEAIEAQRARLAGRVETLLQQLEDAQPYTLREMLQHLEGPRR